MHWLILRILKCLQGGLNFCFFINKIMFWIYSGKKLFDDFVKHSISKMWRLLMFTLRSWHNMYCISYFILFSKVFNSPLLTTWHTRTSTPHTSKRVFCQLQENYISHNAMGSEGVGSEGRAVRKTLKRKNGGKTKRRWTRRVCSFLF